tara:strand:- start:21370 stop:21777 length:408 start_codon:yes stop_codon:yes gene_type:complete
MKFQKDNKKVALTKEVKQEIKREREERVIQEKREAKERKRVEKEFWSLKDEFQKVTDNLAARHMAYLPVDLQLDMLWHDMESGAIKVDKRKANTWYSHIKSVKENYPLSENWKEEIREINEEVQKLMANNKIEVV